MTSKRRLREQLYIAEAERNAWHRAYQEKSDALEESKEIFKRALCRVDTAPDGGIEAVEKLLDGFVERWTGSDGEQFYTVTDNYYLDTDFFKDLFNIIDTSNSNEGK